LERDSRLPAPGGTRPWKPCFRVQWF